MNQQKDITAFQLYRMIRFLFDRYKLEIMILTVSSLLVSIIESANLMVLYPLMNYGLDQPSNSVVIDAFDTFLVFSFTDNAFLFYCYVLIAISLVSVGTRVLVYFFSYRLQKQVSAFFFKAVCSKYLTVDYSFFVKNHQGKLIHTGTIASTTASSMALGFIRVISAFFTFLLMFASLIIISWEGTLLMIIIGTGYFFVTKAVAWKIIYPFGGLLVEAQRKRNVQLNELITGIKAIKVFLVSRVWQKKYDKTVEDQTTYEFKMLMGRVAPESLIKLTLFLVIAVSGIVLNYKSQGNILPLIPVFGTFVLMATRLLPAAQALGNGLMNLVALLPNIRILHDLLSENPQMVKEGTKVLSAFNEEIRFNEVGFRFPGADQALFEGISFSIERKKTTALVGSSGNGKSTLINLLFRLYPLEKGSITIDGEDITSYTIASYLSKISYVSQETFIYNTTIKENIQFGMHNCRDEMIIESAKLANAHEFIMETENGYDTVVGDAGIKLSGGQRQRIAIARALLRKPEIMVLDEATSSLDNISEGKVQEAINNLTKYTTVLIIAHRLSTIIDADKILVLSEGKIKEEGTHQNLLNLGGVYSSLYNMQSDAIM